MSEDKDVLAELLFNIAENRCRDSYQTLFKEIAPRVLSMARKQLFDESLAYEMVQETMLKLWLKAHLYDASKGAAVNWIFSVARNVKFDLLRRSKHQQDWIQGDDLWPILSEDRDINENAPEDREIISQQLQYQIEQLPIEQADIVRRVYLHGESQQEVADKLELPLGTVKSRLRLGLKKMKEALDD